MSETSLLILAREFKKLRDDTRRILGMPVGPQGEQGEKGERGEQGLTGRDGVDGRDGIIMSYQVPAGTVNVPGRRLCLRGLFLNSYVQTVVAGGPYIAEWFLAFGHTAVSLATTEAATTKAPRRIALPFVQAITANQAVSTLVSQNETFCDFGDAPVYVNPGEFIQICTRHIGTVGTSGTVVHRITPVFGWE